MIVTGKIGEGLASFDEAVKITLEHEGGYANHPDDPGGETNFGISRRAYPNEDIRNLTLERAAYLYKRDYWFPMRLDSIHDQQLANNLFDFAVHHGVRGTAKKWQLVLARHFGYKGAIDGLVGGQTIAWTNNRIHDGEGYLLNSKLVQARILYYTSSAKPIFLKNFVNRAIGYL